MITIFSDLYLKLFYQYIREEEENSYRPESECNMRSRNTIENEPITSRTTFPVLEKPSEVHNLSSKSKMIQDIESETMNMTEWNNDYI